MEIKKNIEVRHDYDDCDGERCYIHAGGGEEFPDRVSLEMSLPYPDGATIGSWTSLSQDQAQDLINVLQAYLNEVNRPEPMVVKMPVYNDIWTPDGLPPYHPDIHFPHGPIVAYSGFSDGPWTGDTE